MKGLGGSGRVWKGPKGSWWERVLEAKESDLSEGPGGDTPIYNLFKLFMA